jgi:hypothetical protein
MMKPRLLHMFIIGTCFTTLLVAIAGAQPNSLPAVSATGSVAGQIGEILRQVEAVTKPPKGYSATIHQTVTRTSVAASASSSAGQAELLAEEDYAVSCTDDGTAHVTKQLSSTRAKETVPAAAGPGSNIARGGLLTVSPLMALQYVAKMASQKIVNDLYQSVPCYEISAGDAQFGLVVWISKTDSSVRRVVLEHGASVEYDATLIYETWNGVLLPSHVEITCPSTGVKMVQDYTGRAF